LAGPGGGPWGIPPPPGTEIDRIRAAVAQYFPVYETRITPQSLLLLVHADPASLEERFDRLRQDLWRQYYVPQIRRERGEFIVEVVRRPTRRPWSSLANVILLALTVLTTVTAGAFLWLSFAGGSQLTASDFLWGGLSFALPLMLILGLHELAHFVMARHHRVEASLPYFIPVPPPFLLFGTFGAFISLREPIPDKKALLDIGASGPLAGFAVSIPVTLFGLFLSAHTHPLSVANCGPSILGVTYGNFLIGPSLIWFVLSKFIPLGLVSLHPVALAGWVGLLVTAINLLPAGQLDGGHVFRALLGDRARFVSYAAVALLFGLGVFLYQGWIIFAILILFLGMRHPPPLNDISPLDAKRLAVGLVAAGILVAGFVIVPIAAPSGDFAVGNPSFTPVALPAGAALADNVSLTTVNQDEISHGYLVSGTITSVVATVGGKPMELTGPALAAFEANSTWRVYLPNGNTSNFTGAGAFSEPTDQYFALDPGGSANVTVTYLNSQPAVVTLSVTVAELCNGGGPAPQSVKVTIQ
jgi:hypothetical protein